jgi:hypothetical protein
MQVYYAIYEFSSRHMRKSIFRINFNLNKAKHDYQINPRTNLYTIMYYNMFISVLIHIAKYLCVVNLVDYSRACEHNMIDGGIFISNIK